jgi:hypothetical protein
MTFFLVPGIGPLLVAGPFVQVLLSTFEEKVVFDGMTPFGTGLYAMGIPKFSIARYEIALESDEFLLFSHCSDWEAALPKEILEATTPSYVRQYSAIERQTACI